MSFFKTPKTNMKSQMNSLVNTYTPLIPRVAKKIYARLKSVKFTPMGMGMGGENVKKMGMRQILLKWVWVWVWV